MRKRRLLYLLISLSCIINVIANTKSSDRFFSAKTANAAQYKNSMNVNNSNQTTSMVNYIIDCNNVISDFFIKAIGKLEDCCANAQTVIKEEKENLITSDYLELADKRIPLAYGTATQWMVDTYDVVQDDGIVDNIYNNVFLFGHNTGSFSMLNLINVGDVIKLDNYGITKEYEVERNEIGILTADGKDITFLSDGNNAIYTDYGYKVLMLITCATGYEWNYRRVVIARELN